jgi:hypothetical protein
MSSVLHECGSILELSPDQGVWGGSGSADRAGAGIYSLDALDDGIPLVVQAVHDHQWLAATARRPGEEALGAEASRGVLCCATRRGDDYDRHSAPENE